MGKNLYPSCILSKFYIKPQPRAAAKAKSFSLYLIEILHQTTTVYNYYINQQMLYLIEILHQTTTILDSFRFCYSCILSKFYIKPQRKEVLSLLTIGCILSKFYIKPQLLSSIVAALAGCILSKFYIKPQLARICSYSAIRCILSKFYIKPQLEVVHC